MKKTFIHPDRWLRGSVLTKGKFSIAFIFFSFLDFDRKPLLF